MTAMLEEVTAEQCDIVPSSFLNIEKDMGRDGHTRGLVYRVYLCRLSCNVQQLNTAQKVV